jgi:hypothetical protein
VNIVARLVGTERPSQLSAYVIEGALCVLSMMRPHRGRRAQGLLLGCSSSVRLARSTAGGIISPMPIHIRSVAALS